MLQPDTEEKKRSKEIDRRLRATRREMDKEVKILLLGAGESGKSTLAKQMKILHLQGFRDDERNNYKAVIASNVIISMKDLIKECKARTHLTIQNPAAADRVLELPDTPRVISTQAALSTQAAADVRELWADPAIKETFRSVVYILDNVKHYFDDVDRISAEGYVPSNEDILMSRAATSGIYETEFDIEEAHFKMIDVGGQKSERRKWINCFDCVTAVLFCVAMSEYDQVLQEDGVTNRMHESLTLFADVCKSSWFAETAIILFLNKEDVFREKIARVPLTKCFPEYGGPNEEIPAREYISKRFADVAAEAAAKAAAENSTHTNRLIYPHFTCATNTRNIEVVFKAVRDIVLRAHLVKNGILA
jgi:GTPase SAR1 family protein